MDIDNEQLDRKYLTQYILHHVGDLSLTERRYIFQIISNSNIETDRIQEKGGGVQIKFKDISHEVMYKIYKYAKGRIDEKLEKLNDFTEANNESVDEDN